MAYAILGRKKSIKQIVDGDIDIVISSKWFNQLESIILDFASKNNLRYIQCFQHESTAKYFVLLDETDNSLICPDFCTDYVRNKRLLIKNKLLLDNIVSTQVEGINMNKLSSEFEFIYYFLKKVDKGEIDEEEFKHLCCQFEKSDKKKLYEIISNSFSLGVVEFIIESFSNKDYLKIEDNVFLLRKALRKETRVTLKYYYRDLLLKVKRVIYRTGLSIVILGPDGCGKSTIITGLFNNLKNVFRRQQYYHLMPKKIKQKKTNTKPHESPPYSFIASQIKLIFLILSYNLGHIRVLIKLIKSTLVVFDRYFDDIFVDKIRFRYRGAKIFLNIASLFIPKPDIYFYLDAPAEVIYGRKKELTIEEINKQRKKYKTLIKNKKSGYLINANQEPSKVISDIEKILFKHLENRQKSRV
jgi:thymidylate kinase